MYDAIVVGTGFAGSIIARHFADDGKKVLIFEKRNHIAGNMYDYVDENGILVQAYGPHAFHTNNKEVFDYLKKYSDFNEYRLNCMVYMNEKYTPSPFNFQTIDDYFEKEKAEVIKNRIREVYKGRDKATIVEMLESKDNLIKEFADFLFENDYSLYTAKQWGIKPSEIDVSVLKRVPVLFSYKTGYFDDKYQALPKGGFSKLISNILDSPNIEIRLNTNAKEYLKVDLDNKCILFNNEKIDIPVIYTGAVDELLDYKFGLLPYRSLNFKYQVFDKDSYQDAALVAYPQVDGYTRITEFTKIPYQNNSKTKIAFEYPMQYTRELNSEPYYPIINDNNNSKYNRYVSEIKDINNLFLCGRLAEYKYYNMDQIIERTIKLINEL